MRHKKLTSFSLSDKDTKSGISGNATNREYLILRHPTISILCRQDRKMWAMDVNTQAQGANSWININTEEIYSDIYHKAWYNVLIHHFCNQSKGRQRKHVHQVTRQRKIVRKNWLKVQKDVERQELETAIDSSKIKFNRNKHKHALVFKRFKVYKSKCEIVESWFINNYQGLLSDYKLSSSFRKCCRNLRLH